MNTPTISHTQTYLIANDDTITQASEDIAKARRATPLNAYTLPSSHHRLYRPILTPPRTTHSPTIILVDDTKHRHLRT